MLTSSLRLPRHASLPRLASLSPSLLHAPGLLMGAAACSSSGERLRFSTGQRLLSSSSSGDRLRLFKGQKMANATRKQRILSTTVQEALSVTLASGMIKDGGFADGAAVHVKDVQVSSDGLLARILWEPMDERYMADDVGRALRREGILRRHVNSYLNQVCVCV